LSATGTFLADLADLLLKVAVLVDNGIVLIHPEVGREKSLDLASSWLVTPDICDGGPKSVNRVK